MRRPLIIAVTTGAVLAAGLAAVPALAATDPPTPSPTASSSSGAWSCPMGDPSQARAGRGDGRGGPGMGHGMGYGMGRGRGGGQGMGQGMGQGRMGPGAGPGRWGGSADPLAGLAKGTLTGDQKTTLAGMAEEEKLAHDVYTALAAKTGDLRFSRIAGAESRHLAEVRALLTRYGVSDPTAGKADGVFASPGVQKQYTDLVARGDDSLSAALAVGRDIESADIADLAKAGAAVTAQDVRTVYARLGNASSMHLRAFGGDVTRS